jgi:hypothetical protein
LNRLVQNPIEIDEIRGEQLCHGLTVTEEG